MLLPSSSEPFLLAVFCTKLIPTKLPSRRASVEMQMKLRLSYHLSWIVKMLSVVRFCKKSAYKILVLATRKKMCQIGTEVLVRMKDVLCFAN